MVIWFSFIIPLIGAFIMLRWFRKYLAWWEVVIPIIACLLFTLIFKFTVEIIQTSDTEYNSSIVVKATYYEAYTTWVKKTCSRTIKVGKTTTTVYYDCSYCDENGPEWEIEDANGRVFRISESFYDNLKKRWNSPETFVDLNRDIDYSGTCGSDGDSYEIYWNNDPNTAEQTVKASSYENRIQAAHTSFDFPDVKDLDVKQYKLYEYPEIRGLGFSQNIILGLDSIKWITKKEKYEADRLMQFSSGYWGYKRKAKIWILLYLDLHQTSALMQEAYWDGGNDNDIVICLGLSSVDKEIRWTKVFSWGENKKILVDLREDIMGDRYLDFKKVQYHLQNRMTGFRKKDFKEFSYVTVEPPTWAVIVTFIVSLLLTIGLSYWAIVNDYVTDENDMVKKIDNKLINTKDNLISIIKRAKAYIRETYLKIRNKINKIF